LRTLCKTILANAQPDVPMVLDPAGNPEHAEFAKLGHSVLVHPVSRDDNVIGVLIAGERRGPDPAVSSVDMKLLGATATSMAIFLENAALYDDLNTMFLGTLEALTASIDAKDAYTSGHSQRVAHLTKLLAKAMDLDEHTVSRMHIAGLVHDVGKIGVPEAVLTKPGRLTAEEFDEIRKHPEIGYRILKDIPQLRDILPGVLYHHERVDGGGYPKGLPGAEIPLVARLISLADAFDAMSSTRTYRKTLSRREAIQEILDCAGTQFDPELAPIFVKLDFSEFDRLFDEHRAKERKALKEKDEAA
jgi:HD-GYP domain-containing protein (c-di-GMP phosphodiesterase class II)